MNHIRFSGLVLALALLLGGCVQAPKEYNQQLFAMDTLMSLTAYGKEGEQALTSAAARVAQLEQELSVTREDSDVYAINHADGGWTQVSKDTFDLLRHALSLCDATDGSLDITAYPAVRAWGFTTGEYRVPDQEEREALAEKIDYTAVELDEQTCSVRLPQGMELDLGAVAKGWTGDQLAALMSQAGVESAILRLGGNIQTVGSKPDGSVWRVGIQDPAADEGTNLAVLEVADRAVVTSGGYQRYFEKDGQTYWHIMDPDTAAPARSGLLSATIVGPRGADCDALSTALFVMGAEEAAKFWREHQDLDFEYILVLEDGFIHITQGLENVFTLTSAYQDRKVRVVGL